MFRFDESELKFLYELEVLLVDPFNVDKYSIYLWRQDALYLVNLSKINLLIRLYDGDFPALAMRDESKLKDFYGRVTDYLIKVERGANRVSEVVSHEPDDVLAQRLSWKVNDLFKILIELSCLTVLKNEIEAGVWHQDNEAKSRERAHQIAVIIPRIKEKMSMSAREVLALLELADSIPLSPQQALMIYDELFQRYSTKIKRSDLDFFMKLKVTPSKNDLFVITQHLTKLCRFACSPHAKSGKSEMEIISSLLEGLRAVQAKLSSPRLYSKSVSSECLVSQESGFQNTLKKSV